MPFGGGTDLMVKLRRSTGALPAFPKPVLFLDRVAELQGIERRDGALWIGASASLADIAAHPAVHPSLRESILSIGAPGLRNSATLAGNVCNASPAADTLPFLYAFEARVRLVSRAAERTIGVEDLILGPGSTCLSPSEVLTHVLIPLWDPDVRLWRKVGTRRANALTKVSIAGFSEVRDGRAARTRICLGAVAPTVVRSREVERLVDGRTPEELRRSEDEVRRAAREAVRPIDDQRSTAEYRRHVAENLVWYFVGQVLGHLETRFQGG